MPDNLNKSETNTQSDASQPDENAGAHDEASESPDTTVIPEISGGANRDRVRSATTNAILPGEIQDVALPRETQTVIQPDTIAIHLPGREQPLTFKGKDEIVLGRGGSSNMPDIDLLTDQGVLLGVSRKHAVIRRTSDGYYLSDLNSTNGSWLNGKMLVPDQPYRLHSGDQVRLGQLLLFIYFSFSNEKTISTILLEDKVKSHTDQLREGLTIQFLQEKLLPYLRTIIEIQKIVDEAKDQPFLVNIQRIGMHKNGKWIEVIVRGIHESMDIMRKTIIPLRDAQDADLPGLRQSTSAPVSTIPLPSDEEVQPTEEEPAPVQQEQSRENLAKQIITAVSPTLADDKRDELVQRMQSLLSAVFSSDIKIVP
jgi:pSer/pThr/pTyr-binding forkhead associated (FHA) protein